MRIREMRTEEAIVLEVAGKLIAGGAERILRQAVERSLSERPASLLFDLARVSVMDAAGVGELASSYIKAKEVGCEIALIAPRSRIVTLLTLCGLGDFFPVFSSTAEALETARERSARRFPMYMAPESMSPAFPAPACS